MKPQVLFELTKLGIPVAWIKKVKWISIITKPHGTFIVLDKEPDCLIWKPELFQPKLTGK